MDAKDRRILELLQEDGRRTQAEIGRRVGLAPATVNERIRRLAEEGILRRWTVIVDDRRVGVELTVFIEVFIDHPRHEAAFVRLMDSLPEVQECHFVTGDYSCLVKAKVPDRNGLRELVLDRINALPGVHRTRTLVVLETRKEDPRVAIPLLDGRGAEVPDPRGGRRR